MKREAPDAQQSGVRICIETDTGSYPNVYGDRTHSGINPYSGSPVAPELRMVLCEEFCAPRGHAAK